MTSDARVSSAKIIPAKAADRGVRNADCWRPIGLAELSGAAAISSPDQITCGSRTRARLREMKEPRLRHPPGHVPPLLEQRRDRRRDPARLEREQPPPRGRLGVEVGDRPVAPRGVQEPVGEPGLLVAVGGNDQPGGRLKLMDDDQGGADVPEQQLPHARECVLAVAHRHGWPRGVLTPRSLSRSAIAR